MSNLLTVKIDVRKLDKARFFEGKADKDGHKPLYADIVLVPRREIGQYGDTHIVKQSKKKDENVEMPIIGNATERVRNEQAPRTSGSQSAPASSSDDDAPPF